MYFLMHSKRREGIQFAASGINLFSSFILMYLQVANAKSKNLLHWDIQKASFIKPRRDQYWSGSGIDACIKSQPNRSTCFNINPRVEQ